MKNNIICHITTAHQPFDDRIFHKECKTLAKNGYRVFLIVQHKNKEVIEGVHIIPLPIVKNRLKRISILPITALLKAIKLKADIYHFHDPELIIIGIILKMLTRKIIIYDAHENYRKQFRAKKYIPEIFRFQLSLLIKNLENLLSKIIDGIVVPTEEIANNFKLYNYNTLVIKNYPIISNYYLMDKNNDKKEYYEIAYVGGISEDRGILQLLEALNIINEVNKVKLNLYGKYENDDLKRKVERCNASDYIKYFGFIEFERIHYELRKADAGIVCLLPISNYINSMPIKLFEYIFAGIPVISSNFPLWKEIVEGNECGICVDPTKPEEIARAIKYLIDHPEESRKMGLNGRKAVLEKYNWEMESKKLLKLYNKILNM